MKKFNWQYEIIHSIFFVGFVILLMRLYLYEINDHNYDLLKMVLTIVWYVAFTVVENLISDKFKD